MNIAERLRLSHPTLEPLHKEAADEIERLQTVCNDQDSQANRNAAQVKRLRYAIKMERGKTEKADADNDRLRRLLREWFDASDPSIGGSPGSLLERTRAALGTADQPDAIPRAAEMAIEEWISPKPGDAPKPKRAYYETHEPPHCPTCECWQEVQPDASLVAAIQWRGMLVTMPRPARHHTILHALYEAGVPTACIGGDCQGFALNGKFLTREETFAITGKGRGGKSFSEDLWGSTADNAAAQPAAANCPDELCKRSGRCRHPDHCATDNSALSK